MKKLFVCALVALSGVLSVNAQGGFGNFDPEEMAKMSVQHMDEQLDLNEEQEEWKTVTDFPRYSVSNFGRIKKNEQERIPMILIKNAHIKVPFPEID